MTYKPVEDAAHILKKRLCETVERYGLFAPGQTVVVGVSGGPDSTALLHALSEMREGWGLSLVVAHLNHGFRGAEADEDADYVASLCARLNVACRSERVDVPALRRAERLSAQEAAREARHTFLRRVAAEEGAERIALGHTRDDRIETVLLNLLRGTGLEGLSGMPPLRLPLVRPLYDVSREETENYCTALDLQPRFDSSNAKTDYTRDRLRAELLPYLATYYNARVGDAVLRMSELVSADNLLLETLADEALQKVIRSQTQESIVLVSAALQTLPLALRRRVLRLAVIAIRGHLHGLAFETLEGALLALAEGRTREITLPSRSAMPVHLRADPMEVRIFLETQEMPLIWQTLIAVPGETDLPAAGLRLKAQISKDPLDARTLLTQADPVLLDASHMGVARSAAPFCFYCRDIRLPILARSWQPGDRIRPRNLGGSKKLQDLFTDCKVPANVRVRFPVLVDAGGEGRILAVVGLQTDETALSLSQRQRAETESVEGGLLALTFSRTEVSPVN